MVKRINTRYSARWSDEDLDVLFLYNCHSGRQQYRAVVEAVVDEFEKNGAKITTKKLDFVGNPFDDVSSVNLVVVAGGDGSVGYVVDAMQREGIDLPLGIIPAGTANDFASMLGIPHNPRKAVQHILQTPIRKVDCGRVNGRYFVNIFSFGLFTTTSQRTFDSYKRLFGRLAYIVEGMRELRHIRSLPLRVDVGDECFDFEVVMALVFNGHTAGRIPLASDAEYDDGLLDGLFFIRRRTLRLIFDALLYLCGGKPTSVLHIKSRSFRITSTLSDIATDVDGQGGPTLPLDVECLHQAIKIRG